MALQENFTLTLATTDDTVLKMTSREGTKVIRRARCTNGDEVTLTISHDEKKRDRHFVETYYDKAATATEAATSFKIHTVIDQPLRPNSQDVKVAQLEAMHKDFVHAHINELLLGES